VDHGYVRYVHMCFWMVHSTGWFAGATIEHPSQAPSTPSDNCGEQEKGTHFDTSHGTAIEWSKGWDLGAALGLKGANLKYSFDTSTQTGYDKNALLHFQFQHTGYICGTNNVPSKAAQLVMRGNKT